MEATWHISHGSSSSSIPHITVTVSHKVQEPKSNCKQTRAQQVSHSCEIRDCRVVRIYMLCPHPVNHYVTDVEKQKNLGTQSQRLKFSGVWHCVGEQVVFTISQYHSALTVRVKWSKKTAGPWRFFKTKQDTHLVTKYHTPQYESPAALLQ